MRRLIVEFVPHRSSWVVLFIWISISLLTAGYLGYRGWLVHAQAHQLDLKNLKTAEEINRLEALMAIRVDAPVRKMQPSYQADAALIARTAAFPLQQVLKALESTQIAGIRISSVALHPDRGSAEVSIDFSDYKTLLTYIEMLNDGDPNPRWALIRAENGSGAGRRQATIRSNW